jgi:transcriptional regulator with XRE-family HTH domain
VLHYDILASELMRALRGERSQEAFGRRLGCRANTIYTWESGRNFPTAARMLSAAERGGIDVEAALVRFYGRRPVWLGGGEAGTALDPSSPEGVRRLIDDLRGSTTTVALAARVGRTRFAVARWLKGEAEPRLPDFLSLLEATSLRMLDFIACLVDPSSLPSIAGTYQNLEATRRAAYDVPWSQAFLRGLELADYRALPAHQPGWLATRLRLSPALEDECLALLERAGQVRRDDAGRFVPAMVTTVDTRRDPAAAQRLRMFWRETGNERLRSAPAETSISAYNLFGISRADLARLFELQRSYFREMRAIIAASEPAEELVLANMHLVQLTASLGELGETSPSHEALPRPGARSSR